MSGVVRFANPSLLAPLLIPGNSQVQLNLPISASYNVDSFRTFGIFNQAIGSIGFAASAPGAQVSGTANSTNGPYSHEYGNSGVFSGFPEEGGSVSTSLPILITPTGTTSVDVAFSVTVDGWTLDISGQADAIAHVQASFTNSLTDSSGNPINLGDYGIEILPPSTPTPDYSGDDEHKPKGCEPASPMASYNFHTMLASLVIKDTPVGYDPPYGYPMPFEVTYTQRETTQPGTFNYTNLGPKWNINWLSYITDDPANFALVSRQARPGGGSLPIAFVATGGGYHTYRFVGRPGMQLRRTVANPLPYEILNADGSKEIYGQSDGSTAAPRRVFLTQRIDPAGNATTISYDAQMRITKITDAIGQEMRLAYDWASDPLKITKVTDPFGRFATFGYDASGRLVTITDAIGIQSVFTYEGASSFINSLTTPYGTTTFANTVNGHIRRITATDPAGDTEVLESNDLMTSGIPFSEAGNLIPTGMTVFHGNLGLRNSFYWDKKRWREAPNDYNKAHIYHWLLNENSNTMSGSLESEKPPLQSRIWYNYPGQPQPQIIGRITTPSKIGRVIEGGTQLMSRGITPLGKVSSETDPVGRVTNFGYSADGFDLTGVSQNENGVPAVLAAFEYNAQHRPLIFTDAGAQPTNYTWNSLGQITAVENAKNETTSFAYYTSDVTGKQRKGRLSQINGALAGNSDVVSFDYDATGNLARVTGPDGYFLRFTYDAFDRLTRVTFPDDTYTETTYLALDPQTSRDRLGRFTHYVYNSIRQLVSVTDPAQRQIRYDYCDCGDMNQLIDAMGRITRWRHDIAGRVTAKIYADGSTINYGYEPLSGRLTTITDEKHQVKTRVYNLDNTLAGINYTNAEHHTPNVAFTYDTDFRRLRTMIDGIGTTTYTHRPIGAGTLGAGRLASVDGPLANDTLTYAYDELSRRISYAINDVGETRSFDPLGRLLSVINPLGTFGYTYAGASARIDTVTYPNGMTGQYTYHPLAGDFRLKDIIHTLPGSVLLSRHSYTYNAVGNITRWTQVSPQAGLNRSWLCGYDDADQLTSVASQDPNTLVLLPTGQYAYGYDRAANRVTETIEGVTTTAHYNALNQLTGLEIGGVSIPPDQTYEWDAEDRLAAINYTGTNQRSEFSIDGYGRRVRIVEKEGSSVTQTSRWLWDGVEMREQQNSDGSVTKRFYQGGFQEDLQPLVYGRDHVGSIRDVVNASGTVVRQYDFDPFGRKAQLSGTGDITFGFTGHFIHAPSRQYLTLWRPYDATKGRWLSRDPLGERIGPNLYSYCRLNPVRYLDPLGLIEECPMCPPRSDGLSGSPNWKREGSDIAGLLGERFFHCGYDVYKQANPEPSPNFPGQECVYDDGGELVGSGHPYEGCGGTPNWYPDDDWWNHSWNDPGGIYHNLYRSRTATMREWFDHFHPF